MEYPNTIIDGLHLKTLWNLTGIRPEYLSLSQIDFLVERVEEQEKGYGAVTKNGENANQYYQREYGKQLEEQRSIPEGGMELRAYAKRRKAFLKKVTQQMKRKYENGEPLY